MTRLERGNRQVRFDELFLADDGRGGLKRINGVSDYGTPNYRVENAGDIARLASNFGMRAGDIETISYATVADRITELSVMFKKDVGAEALNQNNLGMLLALEKKDVLPAGTVFEAKENGLVKTEGVMADVRMRDSLEDLIALHFGAADNRTGQAFSVLVESSSRARIVFGRDQSTDHGSVYRLVSGKEMEASKKIASVLDAAVSGEVGLNSFGVVIIVNRPILEVVTELAAKGIVGSGTAEALRDHLSIQSALVLNGDTARRRLPRRSPAGAKPQ